MNEWTTPAATLLVLAPALAAAFAPRSMTRLTARRVGMATTLSVLAWALGISATFHSGGVEAYDRFDPGRLLWGQPIFAIDELNSALLPFTAIIYAVVLLVEPKTSATEHIVRRLLFSESLVLAIFLCSDPLAIAFLWSLSSAGMYVEVQRQNEVARGGGRVLLAYMLPSCVLLVLGAVAMRMDVGHTGAVASMLIAIAVMIRKGIVPLHSWMPELFADAPLSASVLFNAPQIGAYVAVRLLAPHAPEWVLVTLSLASLVTAVYGAGLALVQVEARRAFGWLFLSQSALILVGLGSRTTIALAGGLSLWISSGLALTGFGMTISALEARRGPLSLVHFAGGYERKPLLAACFLLLGLASVGFPGTLGFVGQEALVDGVVKDFPYIGYAVMLASMLNGITVLRTYFILFCGRFERGTLRQSLQAREQLAFVGLTALLLLGGLFPAPFIRSRSRAVEDIRPAATKEHDSGQAPAQGENGARGAVPFPIEGSTPCRPRARLGASAHPVWLRPVGAE